MHTPFNVNSGHSKSSLEYGTDMNCVVYKREYILYFSVGIYHQLNLFLLQLFCSFSILTVLQPVIDSSMLWFNVQISSICWNWFNFFEFGLKLVLIISIYSIKYRQFIMNECITYYFRLRKN